jgi:hypothetical protein
MELLVGLVGTQIQRAAFGVIAKVSLSTMENTELMFIHDQKMMDRLQVTVEKRLQTEKNRKEALLSLQQLDLKLQIISLPADLCLQLASRGNNILQPAVNVVIETIQEIEDFVDRYDKQKETDGISILTPSFIFAN